MTDVHLSVDFTRSHPERTRLRLAARQDDVDSTRWIDDGGATWDHPNRVFRSAPTSVSAAKPIANAARYRAVKWLDDEGGHGI